MTGDKSKMKSLKKNQYGKVILGNNAPAKVLGKGRDIIYKHRGVADSLFIQGLNHNILSVGQMENKGNVIVFTSSKCKFIDEETR